MYLVIRSLKDENKVNQDYNILEGDILKFGKISFRVKKLIGLSDEDKKLSEKQSSEKSLKEESKNEIEHGHYANSVKTDFREK